MTDAQTLRNELHQLQAFVGEAQRFLSDPHATARAFDVYKAAVLQVLSHPVLLDYVRVCQMPTLESDLEDLQTVMAAARDQLEDEQP